MTKPLELLPCPFCGSLELKVFHHGEPDPDSYVQCQNCSVIGPYHVVGEEAAANAWNTRHFGSPFSQKASNEIGASAQAVPTEASEPTIHNDGASIKPAD